MKLLISFLCSVHDEHEQDEKVLDILLTSSMPLMMGLTKTASRRTTNSNPSPDMRVTYLLGPSMVANDCPVGEWMNEEREREEN